MQVDDDFVVRPKRDLRVQPSERAVVIGAAAVVFVIFVVILVVTW